MPLVLCSRKGIKPSRSCLDCQTIKSGFSIRLYWEQTEKVELGKQRKVASLSKNRDIKKTPQVDIVEDFSTLGIPISAHQCMVTPRAAPSRENLHEVLESLRSMEMYGKTPSWRTVALWRWR